VAKLSAEPLSSLVRALVERENIRRMVETGTSHRATSALWAAGVFRRVTTVEVLPEYVAAARKILAVHSNVKCILGDSSMVLRRLTPKLKRTAFFWLDAHRGGGRHGTGDFCPLIEELNAIAESPASHVVFIDDAHGFLAPLPPPFDHKAWPTLVEVLSAVNQRFAHHCVVFSNVIMCVPSEIREAFDRDVIAQQRTGEMLYKDRKRGKPLAATTD
jgi:hypothetical protein